mgnify:CR=1 FL=1
MLPLSLYIHYPYCVRKCPYCDFNSYKKDQSSNIDELYLKALIEDYASLKDLIYKRNFVSIYLGGGTPSLFEPKYIEKLLNLCADKITSNTEISMEVNPGTVSLENLKAYKDLGVNRLSIGVQSFSELSLKRLGRIHSAKNAYDAYDLARKAGFLNINLDIMHGLPNQSIDEAMFDLKEVARLNPEHLSWYELTIEEDTAFGRNPPKLPQEDELSEIEENGFSFLEKNGFKRYEVSGFFRKEPCKHNLNYWYFYDYAGIGAGAHSKFLSEDKKTLRRAQTSLPEDFIAGRRSSFYDVDSVDLPFEFMLNRLRIFNEISFEEFSNTTNCSFDDILPQLKKACELKLLEFTETGYKLTSLGKRMLNDVLYLFLK